MSVKMMGRVWELDLAQRDRTVLLVLADHCDDFGRNAFPSCDYLVWKTGFARSTVHRAMAGLKRMGAVKATRNASGGRGRVACYELDLSVVPAKPEFTQKGLIAGLFSVRKRVPLVRQKGPTGATSGKELTTGLLPEPSITVQERAREARAAPRSAPRRGASRREALAAWAAAVLWVGAWMSDLGVRYGAPELEARTAAAAASVGWGRLYAADARELGFCRREFLEAWELWRPP